MKKVTLKQIAEKAGCSLNTVSLVLRNQPGVRESTRRLILDAAIELGYNFKAINNEKRNVCIATTLGNSTDPYFYPRFLSCIERELKQRFNNVIVVNNLDGYDATSLRELFNINQIAGLMIVGDMQLQLGRELKALGLPMIAAGGYMQGLGIDAVLEDNATGIFSLIDHLVNSGCQTIGFIGKLGLFASFNDRWMGFVAGMRLKGLTPEEHHVILEPSYAELGDADFLTKLFRRLPTLPEALICSNDSIAMSAVKALCNMGIQVPEDVSVTGYDNSELARLCIPTLTTIDNFPEDQAATAVQRLQQRIDNIRMPALRMLTHVKLIPGGTTKPSRLPDK